MGWAQVVGPHWNWTDSSGDRPVYRTLPHGAVAQLPLDEVARGERVGWLTRLPEDEAAAVVDYLARGVDAPEPAIAES